MANYTKYLKLFARLPLICIGYFNLNLNAQTLETVQCILQNTEIYIFIYPRYQPKQHERIKHWGIHEYISM